MSWPEHTASLSTYLRWLDEHQTRNPYIYWDQCACWTCMKLIINCTLDQSFPKIHCSQGDAHLRFSVHWSARHQFTLRDYGYRASALRALPVFSLVITGTHCIYLSRVSHAEMTWVAGYIPRSFTHPQTVTHPGTNRMSCLYENGEFHSCKVASPELSYLWQ